MDRHTRISAGLALAVAAAALLPGCVTSGSSLMAPGFMDKPSEPPCNVQAFWQKQVMFTPDPANRGVPTPGLAGRVYFSGSDLGATREADGALVVDLYALLPERPASGPVHLERWNIDKDTLKRLMKADAVGVGYTLFLPWGTYQPDVTQVRLKVQYNPVKGTPLYAEGQPMILERNGEGMPVMRERNEQLGRCLPPPTSSPAGNPAQGVAAVQQASATAPPQAQAWGAPPPVPNALPPATPSTVVRQPSGARVIYPTPPPGLVQQSETPGQVQPPGAWSMPMNGGTQAGGWQR